MDALALVLTVYFVAALVLYAIVYAGVLSALRRHQRDTAAAAARATYSAMLQALKEAGLARTPPGGAGPEL